MPHQRHDFLTLKYVSLKKKIFSSLSEYFLLYLLPYHVQIMSQQLCFIIYKNRWFQRECSMRRTVCLSGLYSWFFSLTVLVFVCSCITYFQKWIPVVSSFNVSGRSCLQYFSLSVSIFSSLDTFLVNSSYLVEIHHRKTDAELKSSSLTAIINNLEEHTKCSVVVLRAWHKKWERLKNSPLAVVHLERNIHSRCIGLIILKIYTKMIMNGTIK